MSSLNALGRVGRRVSVGLVLLFGIALMYFHISGRLSSRSSAVATAAYIALIVALFRNLYPQYRSVLDRRIQALDLVKAAVWLVAAPLWIAIFIRLVNETPLGVTVVLVPSLIFLGISTYFFISGIGSFGRSHDKATSDDDV